MIVWAEMLLTFHTDGSITKTRAFGGAGNDTNVVGHDLILQRRHDLTDGCCGFANWLPSRGYSPRIRFLWSTMS